MERPMISAFKSLLFGTAGVPLSTPVSTTLAAIEHIKKLGLDCLEVEFVKGVKMGSDTARQIGQKADSLGIRLSVHAPYYINLNSPETGKRLASQERLIASARLALLLGAKNVVFHGGYYGHDSTEKTYENIKAGLGNVLSILRVEKTPVTLRPETMGKRGQFGTLDEILSMCRELDGLLPCLDISHVHAREQGENSYRYFHRILGKVEKKLGREGLEDMHIHVSGVLYGDKGEIKHLNLIKSDFNFDGWLEALKDTGAAGMLICESPNLESDALMLKNIYESYRLKAADHHY
jgi:deoxyribonuclease-4